jgi:hypothetical protein
MRSHLEGFSTLTLCVSHGGCHLKTERSQRGLYKKEKRVFSAFLTPSGFGVTFFYRGLRPSLFCCNKQTQWMATWIAQRMATWTMATWCVVRWTVDVVDNKIPVPISDVM